MTNQEILKEAINKAIDNGWKPKWVGYENGYYKDDEHYWPIVWEAKREPYISFKYESLIFNHDFARNLWGEEYVCARDGNEVNQAEAKDTPWRVSCEYENGDYSFAIKKFECHLQEMVIADNPITYLGENI